MEKKKDIRQILKEKKPLIDKAIEKYIPRKHNQRTLERIYGEPQFKFHVEAANKGISEPIWEFLDRGGKRWRPTLFLLVCEALGGDPEKVFDFVVIPEIIHNGTLMHDDIEDKSEKRRGKPCTYKVFGNDIAINTGDAMYYLPMVVAMLNKNKFPDKVINKVYETYIQEMMNLCYGQAMDISWHKGLANADKVTKEEYLQMCAFKTGTLARMSAKIAAILAGTNDRMVKKVGHLAESIGVAFQIQDDIINLTSQEYAKGVGLVGFDITEGKRTLIVIHTLDKAGEKDRKRLLEILNMHTKDQKTINEAIDIMKKYDSIEYAKNFARNMVKEAWDDIDSLLPESEAKDKLRSFADFLVEREI